MKTPSKIKFNHDRRELFVAGRELALPPAEYAILHALHATGHALTREQLGREIGYSSEQIEVSSRTVDQHISRLRRKMKAHGNAIQTVTGHGYKLAASYL